MRIARIADIIRAAVDALCAALGSAKSSDEKAATVDALAAAG